MTTEAKPNIEREAWKHVLVLAKARTAAEVADHDLWSDPGEAARAKAMLDELLRCHADGGTQVPDDLVAVADAIIAAANVATVTS